MLKRWIFCSVWWDTLILWTLEFLKNFVALAFLLPKIVGKCILISRERFTIDIKYNSEVIDIFKKQAKTGAYNAKERSWNFNLNEHDDLIFKLRPLQSKINVHIEALPKWIIDTFKNFKLKILKEDQIDFSDVESSIAGKIFMWPDFF